MAGRIEGKVAIVTGAGRGIGRAIAQRFAAEGAQLFIVDVSGEEAAAADIGGGAVAHRCDISDPAAVRSAVARCVERFGRVDILANNAGISGGSAPLHMISDETWDRVFSVNLRGAFLVLRETIAQMLRNGGARSSTPVRSEASARRRAQEPISRRKAACS